MVYVGSSVNIRSRINSHYSLLNRDSHFNSKLQDAFRINGLPNYIVLEQCSTSDLKIREQWWINELDSYNVGFNMSNNSTGASIGHLHPLAKISEDLIVSIFMDLAHTTDTAINIANKYGVSISIVQDISCGNTHKHLENTYPEDYKILLHKIGKRVSGSSCAYDKGKFYSDIIAPDGVVYSVKNIREFCREHSLDQSALTKVLNLKAKTHKGWRLSE